METRVGSIPQPSWVVPRSLRRTVAVLVALASACNHSSAPLPTSDTAVAASEPVVDVQTAHLRRGALNERISAPGSLMARRESQIGTEVSGRLLHVFVVEGERVEAGAPLFEIDPASYTFALRQAEAGLDVARAERRQVQSDLARAQTLERKRVLAAQEIERLATSLQVAEARVRQASEAVALARQSLERTAVHAPYAGSVSKRLADEGTTALVQPQTVVIVLQETSALEAEAAIPESQMALVHVGNPVLIHVQGLADPIKSEISSVSDSIDPATRTYLVKMPVPNPEFRIKAGVFAHIEIESQATADAILAPREALRIEEGRTQLLVAENGRVSTKPVEIGVVSAGEAQLLAGAEGDELVIVGDAARTIAPGMKVRPLAPSDRGA